jgi:uncharacterized membrane protein YGL010W
MSAPLLGSSKPVKVPSFLLRTFPLFKNNSNLLDELSFVFYYHSQTINQYLHLATTSIALFCLIAACSFIPVEYGGFPFFSLLIPIPYFIIFMILHPLVGIMWGVTFGGFVAGAIFLNKFLVTYFHYWTIISVYFALSIVSLASQGSFHICIEKRLPAFRIFEFLVTTPFFLMMNVAFFFHWRRDILEEIQSKSKQWVGSERRKFGNN